MIDINNKRLKPGYEGYDSMRENALKMFGNEMRNVVERNERPGSFSAPSRTKMRLFNKGGIVSEVRNNLHIPHQMDYGKSLNSQPKEQKGYHFKKGGHMNSKKNSYSSGGHFTEVYGHSKTFREGGQPRAFAGGGSTIYERQMDGEHHGRATPQATYEGEMRGTRCVHRAGASKSETSHHYRPKLEGLNHGGQPSRFAAGGVAKMRHGQSSKDGTQMSKSSNRVKVY